MGGAGLGGDEWFTRCEIDGFFASQPPSDASESDCHDDDADRKGYGCRKWIVAPLIRFTNFQPAQHVPRDCSDSHTATPDDRPQPRRYVAT